MYFQKAAIGRAKRERTRGVIIDSAIEAFSKEGISGARVSSIAEQAGITGATFYKHFRDKDELTAATAAAIILEVNRTIADKIEPIDDPVIRVTALCSCVLKVLLNQKKWASIVVDSFHYLREIRDEITQIMREQIEEGIARGKFKAELNDFLIEQLASLIMSSIRNQMQAGYSERNSELTCEHILRLLGLSSSAAAKAVEKWRPQFNTLALPLPGFQPDED
ncbi:MAG: TetR/AcrR family transcriptional regulator [Pseudomonadota bacterium]